MKPRFISIIYQKTSAADRAQIHFFIRTCKFRSRLGVLNISPIWASIVLKLFFNFTLRHINSKAGTVSYFVPKFFLKSMLPIMLVAKEAAPVIHWIQNLLYSLACLTKDGQGKPGPSITPKAKNALHVKETETDQPGRSVKFVCLSVFYCLFLRLFALLGLFVCG